MRKIKYNFIVTIIMHGVLNQSLHFGLLPYTMLSNKLKLQIMLKVQKVFFFNCEEQTFVYVRYLELNCENRH